MDPYRRAAHPGHRRHARLGTAGGSGFGYYGISPESPDATRIAYVQFAQLPTSTKAHFPAELRVCDRDLGNRRPVAHIAAAGLHNTAMPVWIDNRFIAFQSGYHETFVADADNGGIVHGPIPGQLQHNVHEGQFLVCLNQENAEPDSRGIYSVDGRTGACRMVLPTAALQPYAARLGEPNLAKYVLQHVQWSTDGSHLALKVYAGRGRDWALLTLRADGSDLLWFGRKPMHFQWFDADTLFGHDSEVEDGLPNNRELRRWRRDGTVVETLAGPGCHPAMSPDREWIATEDWYGSDPVRLLLYRRGESRPTAVLATMAGAATIWGLSTHVNPSFSAAGQRVYFTRTDGDAPGQAWFADLRAVADSVSRPD